MTTTEPGSPDGWPAFLSSEIPNRPEAECLFHVIPAPYEATVSYGRGAAHGARAILEASYQLEAYDGVSCPCERGIFTQPPVNVSGPPERVLARIAHAVRRAAAGGSVPVLLGGEHTVTWGAINALKDLGHTFAVLQFDAHADLRNTYEGGRWSHACVMRRVLELGVPLFQVGVRALSTAEVAFRRKAHVGHLDACVIARDGLPQPILPADLPEQLYITFDVDALDPSIMPATGTPEPGGLPWYTTMDILEAVLRGRRALGLDVVELAPVAGFHAPAFTAARLVYNLMGLIARSRP